MGVLFHSPPLVTSLHASHNYACFRRSACQTFMSQSLNLGNCKGIVSLGNINLTWAKLVYVIMTMFRGETYQLMTLLFSNYFNFVWFFLLNCIFLLRQRVFLFTGKKSKECSPLRPKRFCQSFGYCCLEYVPVELNEWCHVAMSHLLSVFPLAVFLCKLIKYKYTPNTIYFVCLCRTWHFNFPWSISCPFFPPKCIMMYKKNFWIK